MLRTLTEIIAKHAEALPDQAALLCQDQIVTYRELEESTIALAAHLREQGLNPGDRVAIHWSNSIEPVKLFLACFRAGLVAVPINTRLTSLEIQFVLENSQSSVCFSEPKLADAARDAAQCSSLKGFFTELPNLSSERANRQELSGPESDVISLFLYTSGTTARPKGVQHSHRTLFSIAEKSSQYLDESVRVTPVVSPIMHGFGLAMCLCPALLSGATAAMQPNPDPRAILDSIERFQCTNLSCLPALAQSILAEQMARPRQVESLQRAFSSGDRVSEELKAQFKAVMAAPLFELFASSECGLVTVSLPSSVRPDSMGKAADGVETRIVDKKRDPVSDGQVGELAAKSPTLFQGYWNDPDMTAATLCAGWFYTGDLVIRDREGFHTFVGRTKEIIVRGGSNVSPAEVESVLSLHPAVKEAAVVGVPDPILGERVMAFVISTRGDQMNKAELQNHARQFLAEYKIPEQIEFVPKLPKTASGKLNRRGLRERMSPGVPSMEEASDTLPATQEFADR